MGKATFTVIFNATGEERSVTAKIADIKEGLWLDENDNPLSQTNGLTESLFFGEKVKIQVITEYTSNGKEIEVEMKAKNKDGYVPYTEDGENKKYTLTVKDNKATSEELIYINPLWYNEEIENYNANSYETEIISDESITFMFDAKFKTLDDKHKKIDLPKDDTKKLRPVTYRRNYEELIGLHEENNPGNKHILNNYENKYIDDDSEIHDLVENFIGYITTKDLTLDDINKRVELDAKKLWEVGVKIVQGGKLDDRILYWARNKMEVYLKRHPLFKGDIDFKISMVNTGTTTLGDTIRRFEELSRNYTGIDFSKAGNNKKILVTGFDPFGLDSNPKQSNPSGIVALALHNNIELGAYIYTMMFPVRYTDFDKDIRHDQGQGDGVVEKYIGDVIKDFDAIITVSQSSPGKYNIDVFATVTRGGYTENMNYTRSKIQKALNGTCPETIGTTLPKTFEYGKATYYGKYFETETDKDTYNRYNSRKNRKKIESVIKDFESKDKSGYYQGKTSQYTKDKAFYDKIKIIKKHLNSQKDCDVTNFPKQYTFSGPGSNYLSNEIFYRVSKLREDYDKNLPTGHFHISQIQKGTEDLKRTKARKLLKTVKKTFEEGFKGI